MFPTLENTVHEMFHKTDEHENDLCLHTESTCMHRCTQIVPGIVKDFCLLVFHCLSTISVSVFLTLSHRPGNVLDGLCATLWPRKLTTTVSALKKCFL